MNPLDDTDRTTTPWQARFAAPFPVAMRTAVGRGGDLTVIVTQGADDFSLQVWNGVTRELRDVPFAGASFATTVTADGRWILDLLDPTGSEVGHLHATSFDGAISRNLTPDFDAYVVRGLDVTADCRFVVLTVANEHGFAVWKLDIEQREAPRRLFWSESEAWLAIVSSDATLVALDTTDHNPGIRRFAVTVVDAGTGDILSTLTDGPSAPVRRVAFSNVEGDPRLLANTERTGFARPVVWNPLTGERIDIGLEDLHGDAIALDWNARRGRVLILHNDAGVHALLEHDLASGVTSLLSAQPGAYADFDVADAFPVIFSSHYAPDGALRLVHSRWDQPIRVLELDDGGNSVEVLPPATVPAGVSFESCTVRSADSTPVQLWVGRPPSGEIIGAVLEVHGGPNLVTVDRYDPTAQAWIDAGFVFASLNYRGSVAFGREHREGFWGNVGEHELDDIAAAVDRLVQAEGVPASAIFITGASYGGFLTLLSLGRRPELFAGGLAHVAQADWVAAYPDMTPALQVAWRNFIGGSLEECPDAWVTASPITYVDSVRAPVWLNQGQYDTRTPAKQAQRYADALRAAGGDVVIEFFQGGHTPGGLEALHIDFSRMLDLARRALAGEAWSAP
ncbi:MAG: prolyl oligopeptidase family serine peptidase [Microthrixaceae bacterium]